MLPSSKYGMLITLSLDFFKMGSLSLSNSASKATRTAAGAPVKIGHHVELKAVDVEALQLVVERGVRVPETIKIGLALGT